METNQLKFFKSALLNDLLRRHNAEQLMGAVLPHYQDRQVKVYCSHDAPESTLCWVNDGQIIDLATKTPIEIDKIFKIKVGVPAENLSKCPVLRDEGHCGDLIGRRWYSSCESDGVVENCFKSADGRVIQLHTHIQPLGVKDTDLEEFFTEDLRVQPQLQAAQ